jgi:hypothetical protein
MSLIYVVPVAASSISSYFVGFSQTQFSYLLILIRYV